uniref:Dynein light chain n=1 Tax=Wollemia nobilis TaxID=56998 RepID=A0A0C9S6B4_9CONI
MLEGRAVVGETDMSQVMQEYAMLCASEALDLHEVTDYEDIARYIKKKFDETYGLAWQCIVGFSFGSSITHMCGSFIYFHVEKLAFLLFKDALFKEDQAHMGLACGKASDFGYVKDSDKTPV